MADDPHDVAFSVVGVFERRYFVDSGVVGLIDLQVLLARLLDRGGSKARTHRIGDRTFVDALCIEQGFVLRVHWRQAKVIVDRGDGRLAGSGVSRSKWSVRSSSTNACS